MKKIIFIFAMILVAGCSSKPAQNNSVGTMEDDAEFTKAAPAPGTPSTTLYAEPTSIASPTPTITPSTQGRSCTTPLGTIPDGGSATGYLKATVKEDEVCVSDTVTCRDGKWSGSAIHPSCKVLRPKVKK